MPVAVNMPTRREESDPLDKIAQALNIASSIYGIKTNMDAAKKAKADQAYLEEQRKNEKEGIINKADILKHADKFDVSVNKAPIDPKDPNGKKLRDDFIAMKLALPKGPDGQDVMGPYEQVFFTPKKKEASPLTQLAAAIQAQTVEKNKLDIAEKKRKAEVEEFNKTPAGKLSTLGADAKAKVGSIVSTVQSIGQYKNLLTQGQAPKYLDANTPWVGSVMSDTEVSKVERKLTDDIGRMRSGGAINKDEEARFLKMLPRPADASEIRSQKLSELELEMATRLQAYGLDSSPDALKAAGFNLGETPAPQYDDAARKAAADELERRKKARGG